jgi:acyl-homoserine lactone acylase PvdQ
MARETSPLVSKIALSVLNALNETEVKSAKHIIDILSAWNGDMNENSVGATVFSTFQYFFYKSLLKNQIKDEAMKLTVIDNFPFIEYF